MIKPKKFLTAVIMAFMFLCSGVFSTNVFGSVDGGTAIDRADMAEISDARNESITSDTKKESMAVGATWLDDEMLPTLPIPKQGSHRRWLSG